MYLFEQLKKISRPNNGFEVKDRYLLGSTEIDNPVTGLKISVPCFVVEELKKPDFVDLKADAFSLQTMLDAGVALKPSTVVSSSFLRETEKFMNKIENSKIE